MFLISQAFLALATRRRCGAGRPGGSGGRAARDPTYGEPPGRCQRSSDFNVFCSAVWKFLLKTYENQCIFNVFPCTKRPHVWPPAWALQADLWFACFLCFGIASLRLLHGKLMKTLILFKPAHVLQRFARVSIWFLIFVEGGFIWFGWFSNASWALALKTYENAYTFQGRMAPATATYLFCMISVNGSPKRFVFSDIGTFCSFRVL